MKRLYDYHDNPNELVIEMNRRKSSIQLPQKSIDADLIDTYQTCRILDEYLLDYFLQNQYILTETERLIDQILDNFEQQVIQALSQQKEQFRMNQKAQKKKFKNIFEYAKAENLYLSNKYTDFISENLGHKFEDIANLSPQVFIPDQVLGIKIRGVDLIIYDLDNQLIKYAQLKTKKDTLTGSQAPRSIKELTIHDYPIFAAALNMGSSWTISIKKAKQYNIELLAGEEFWSLINLSYNMILEKVSKSIHRIDQELYVHLDESQANMIKLLLYSILAKNNG
jgi:hypothetical protein